MNPFVDYIAHHPAILADHAPFMTALREGVVTVIDGSQAVPHRRGDQARHLVRNAALAPLRHGCAVVVALKSRTVPSVCSRAGFSCPLGPWRNSFIPCLLVNSIPFNWTNRRR